MVSAFVLRSLSFAIAASFFGQVAALGSTCTSALTPGAAAGDPFWLQSITKRGTSAFNANPSNYKVFRNVKDYGAKGDGSTDDTAAINAAIADGNRCGNGCHSSTLTPALIYFPSGTYIVSTPIIPFYYTSLVGDRKNLPTIKATAGFNGIAIIDADPYIAGGQYYTNQNNFFRSVRNFVLDTRNIPAGTSGTGLHWQVAQATSLVNVRVEMSQAAGNNHQGIFMENGSGGVMTDLIFNGGKYGIWTGNQQFTIRNITVTNAATAIYRNWGWGWTWQGVTITNCQVGFDIATGGTSNDNQSDGSESILDAVITNTPIFIRTSTSQRSSLAGSIVLDNIVLNNVPVAVKDSTGTVLAGGSLTIPQWIQGNVFQGKNGAATYKQGTITGPTKSSLLTSGGKIVGRSRPQYEGYAASQFISVKAQGALGDGRTDDTAKLQAVFDQYWGCKIIYFDAGTYLITDTLKIPAGATVVGELWSQILGSGSKFSNQASPHVMVQVGKPGDSARTEISDLVFTTTSGSAGAIVLEWNVKDASGAQASAAMWDSHVRLGGFQGSGMQSNNCAKQSGHAIPPCTAAYLAVHLTSTSSAYLENVWVWTADHDLDASGEGQLDIYSGRGILIESQGPVWLIGTASEHHALYQYNDANAKAVYIALIQTETPYWQPTPAAPAPFSTNTSLSDPTFAGGASALGLRIYKSSNVYAYGVNLYSFFSNYGQDCLTPNACQNIILDVDSASTNIYLYNIATIASTFQVAVDGVGVVNQASNRNGFQSTATKWSSASSKEPGAKRIESPRVRQYQTRAARAARFDAMGHQQAARSPE